MYLVMRDGPNGMRSFTLGAVLNDRGSPELEHSAVCDVPAMGWAWLELLQNWDIVVTGALSSKPLGEEHWEGAARLVEQWFQAISL